MRAPLFQLDSFTSRRFSGNPAAVVVLDEFPRDAVMLAVAAENNVSETAFLVPSGGGYDLRWFTPTTEVPLCGHATLAAAAVVLERLETERAAVTFQTLSGPLHVTRRAGRYVMDFPARPVERCAPPDGLAAAIGAEPVEVHENAFNYLVLLADEEQVRSLEPDTSRIARLDRPGLIVTAPGDGRHDIVSRYFAPQKGIPEDPVTGGAHCSLAPFWAPRLNKSVLSAYQASARGGEMTCALDGDRVTLTGDCVFYLEGTIEPGPA
jgi:PhzF family phenazine biosynthesis protein